MEDFVKDLKKIPSVVLSNGQVVFLVIFLLSLILWFYYKLVNVDEVKNVIYWIISSVILFWYATFKIIYPKLISFLKKIIYSKRYDLVLSMIIAVFIFFF